MTMKKEASPNQASADYITSGLPTKPEDQTDVTIQPEKEREAGMSQESQGSKDISEDQQGVDKVCSQDQEYGNLTSNSQSQASSKGTSTACKITKGPDGTCIFECTICDKQYKYKHHLKRHTLLHTGEYKYTCQICGKTFIEVTNYKEHMGTHEGVLYVCQYCGMQFKSRMGLRKHIPKHTGIYPLECSVCQKGFVRRDLLDEHENSHQSDQGLYFCEHCGSNFKSKAGLLGHLPEHTGKYPHFCRTCNKGFTNRNRLDEHERKHEGKGFTCPWCHKMIYRKSTFKKHVTQCQVSKV